MPLCGEVRRSLQPLSVISLLVWRRGIRRASRGFLPISCNCIILRHFGKRVVRLGAGCHGVWCDLVAAGDLAGGGCLANTPLKLTWLITARLGGTTRIEGVLPPTWFPAPAKQLNSDR